MCIRDRFKTPLILHNEELCFICPLWRILLSVPYRITAPFIGRDVTISRYWNYTKIVVNHVAYQLLVTDYETPLYSSPSYFVRTDKIVRVSKNQGYRKKNNSFKTVADSSAFTLLTNYKVQWKWFRECSALLRTMILEILYHLWVLPLHWDLSNWKWIWYT